MIARIVVVLFLCILVIFAITWGVTGGPSRAISSARAISSPFDLLMGDSSGNQFTLPWKTTQTAGPDISGVMGDDYGVSDPAASTQDQIGDLEARYAQLSAQAQKTSALGSPSPAAGHVKLLQAEAGADPAHEFIVLQADVANTSSIDITNWSLQSAYSGSRFAFSPAADPLIGGSVNAVRSVVLEPGASAIAVSGISPVGVSFRENICSGYLAQFQQFTPEFDTSRCPAPGSELPYTDTNLRAYGDSCFGYMSSIPSCHFPGNDPAPGVTPACRSFANSALTYNACVQAHHGEPGFSGGPWRLYLNSAHKIWRTHDIIRLLDDNGRTVDVLTI